MRRLALAALAILVFASPAQADIRWRKGNVDKNGITVGISVSAPGGSTAGHGGDDAGRPLVTYLVTWSVDPQTADAGSLDGLCAAPGGTPTAPVFGFLYHLVGTDSNGKIVDDRYECVAFEGPDTTTRPPAPPTPTLPTFGEAWASAHLPAPVVTLDPARRGITGLETRISTAGPTTVVIDATIRGDTVVGTATLDHYEISVDGQPPTVADHGHYTFETKGDHTVAVGAVWRGTATVSGPDVGPARPPLDLGTATITSTRTYPVGEVRSVLRP